MSEQNDGEIPNLFRRHLHTPGKYGYITGKKRPNVDCILCAIVEKNPEVISAEIYRDEIAVITLNIYPYNPGHLMIFPRRHVTRFKDLTSEESMHLFELIKKSEILMEKAFTPTGFNVGWNEGEFSGASIKHIHIHVVPRYKNELGYMDIIGNTRIAVLTLEQVREKYSKYIEEVFGEI